MTTTIMDALKALVQQKKAIVSSTTNNNNINDSKLGGKKKKKRYLTASQRRQMEQEEEERQLLQLQQSRQQQGGAGKKKKRKRNKRHDDSDDDDEEESEHLTTLLTTKRHLDDDTRRNKLMEENTTIGTAATTTSAPPDSNIHGDGTQSDDGGTSKKKKRTIRDDSVMASLLQLSQDQITNKLRSYGLPIRLFGEKTITTTTTTNVKEQQHQHGDLQRVQRLYTAIKGHEAAMLGASEKDEFLLDSADRTRNVFLEKEDEEEDKEKRTRTTATTTAANSTAAAPPPTKQQDLNDKPKRIYRYFKSLLQQWEQELNSRPESIKKTMSGKNDTKTLKQCKDYIRPLFTLCKRRDLEESLQNHLFNIVIYCEQGEFVKAHDAYMDVAIGRAAWPIGVTMVGIHARSGRAKIESANVAHVMNSELQRKYLTSVKRLMSFAQRMRVDVDPSKKVVNL
jgi:pre-mRNA-splicing factor 18